MKLLIKIIAALSILLALLATGVYFALEPVVTTTVREELKNLDIPDPWILTIEDIQYRVPNSITLIGAELSSEEKKISIKELLVKADIWALLKHKKLEADIEIVSLEHGKTRADASLSLFSGKATGYKEALNPKAIKSVLVRTADIEHNGHHFENITAEALLEETQLKKLDMEVIYKGEKAHLNIERASAGKLDLNVKASYPSVSLKMRLTDKNGDLSIAGMEASFFGAVAESSGTIYSYLSSSPTARFKGTIRSDLAKLSNLPFDADPSEELELGGRFNAKFIITSKGPQIEDLDIESDITVTELSVDNFRVESLSSSLTLQKGIVSMPDITGSLYGGKIEGDFTTDLSSPEKNIFQTDISASEVKLGRMINELSGQKTRVEGDVDGRVFLSGDLRRRDTYSGGCALNAYNANLGPMPIIAPLVGNLYGLVQKALPFSEGLNIHEAYAEFRIANEKATTDNIVFMGKQVLIQGKGWIGFDGAIDFTFENKMKEPEEESDKSESWQRTLQGAIVNFGKMLSSARLSGTVKEPKWHFQYRSPIANTIDKNLKKILDMF